MRKNPDRKLRIAVCGACTLKCETYDSNRAGFSSRMIPEGLLALRDPRRLYLHCDKYDALRAAKERLGR